MHCDLVTLVPEFLDHGIVGVLVRHVECAMNGTPVRVLISLWEQLVLVETPVLIVDSVIESDDDHLKKNNIARNAP